MGINSPASSRFGALIQQKQIKAESLSRQKAAVEGELNKLNSSASQTELTINNKQVSLSEAIVMLQNIKMPTAPTEPSEADYDLTTEEGNSAYQEQLEQFNIENQRYETEKAEAEARKAALEKAINATMQELDIEEDNLQNLLNTAQATENELAQTNADYEVTMGEISEINAELEELQQIEENQPPEETLEEVPVDKKPTSPEEATYDLADDDSFDLTDTDLDALQEEQAEEEANKPYRHTVSHGDTWYGVAQAKYETTDHQQTLEIARQIKSQNGVSATATNMPSEIDLAQTITLKDGTEVKLTNAEGQVDNSHNTDTNYNHSHNVEQREIAAQEQALREAQAAAEARSAQIQSDMISTLNQVHDLASGEFEAQMQKDGWAGDVADGISYLWNNELGERIGIATGNTASAVREDLAEFDNKIAMLQQAAQNGNLEAEFQQQFGIPYSEENMAQFLSDKSQFENATRAITISAMVDQEFGDIVKNYSAAEANNFATSVSPQEFSSVQSKVEGFFGKNAIANVAAQQGINMDSLSKDEQYMFYCELAKSAMGQAKDNETSALGGRTLEDFATSYNNSFNRAFGEENDILTRVSEYNQSQEQGAAVVKGCTEVAVVVGGSAIVVLSGGTATPLVAAGLTAAASAAVEISDRMSNDVDGDLSGKDLGNIAKKSLVNGTLSFVGGKFSKFAVGKVTQMTAGASSTVTNVTGFATKTAIDGTTDLGKDLLNSGVDGAFDIKNVASRYACALIKGGMGKVSSNATVGNLTKAVTKGGHAYVKKAFNDESVKREINALKKQILNDAQNPANVDAQQLAQYMRTNPNEIDRMLYEAAYG